MSIVVVLFAISAKTINFFPKKNPLTEAKGLKIMTFNQCCDLSGTEGAGAATLKNLTSLPSCFT